MILIRQLRKTGSNRNNRVATTIGYSKLGRMPKQAENVYCVHLSAKKRWRGIYRFNESTFGWGYGNDYKLRHVRLMVKQCTVKNKAVHIKSSLVLVRVHPEELHNVGTVCAAVFFLFKCKVTSCETSVMLYYMLRSPTYHYFYRWHCYCVTTK